VVDEGWMRGVIKTADRVGRLSANAKSGQFQESTLVQTEEKNLHTLFLDVSERVQGAVRTSDFARALKELSRLTEPVEIYFDKVMVMHEDPKLRENRLGMLKKLSMLFQGVADLPRIVLQKDAPVESRAV
jgi:glycyl-tRNA synthetase beta chain